MQTATVAYLTTDHLGSPRVNTDKNGNVTARHDYHPFGEEIATSQRNAGLGYADDAVRMQFTGYERDDETELDFAHARFYAKIVGRYTSVDPVLGSADIAEPQTWNRYSYVLNCPLKFSDPLGLYTYDENVSADDRKKLDKAYADLVAARDHYKEGSKKYDAINEALKTLGKPGEVNGVIISTYADTNPGYTSSSADYTDGKTNGHATTFINVDISRAHTDDRNAFDLASTLGHEATHAHNQRTLIASLSGLDSAQYELAATDSAKLIQKSTTEFNAYRVSSYIAEAMLPTKYANVTVNDSEIWNRGWSSADETKKRDLGIRAVLESPKGSYKFKYTGGKKDAPDDPRLWTNGGEKRIFN